jgi:hypothetical protein
MASLVPRKRATVAGQVRSVVSHERPYVILNPSYSFEAGE